MPNTASGISYPASTDPPNGASQMQALAAAVESIFAGGGSIVAGYGSAATYTTTTSGSTYATAVSCTITIPSYWGTYRVLAWATGRSATNADLNIRLSIAGTAIANSEQGGISGSMTTIASATGSATGSVTIVNQMSHNSTGTVVQSPSVIAIAVRTS
jgi:hypothetical protein